MSTKHLFKDEYLLNYSDLREKLLNVHVISTTLTTP